MTNINRVKCKKCKRVYELDIDLIEFDEEIQCPLCGEIGNNYFYNGKGTKSRSYIR